MTRSECTCTATARRWTHDGTCATCSGRVSERMLKPVLLKILCGGTGLALWPNPSGHAVHTGSDGREWHVDYGIGNPPGGGGDYLGVYQGRWVEVETKTATGRLSAKQRARRDLVTRLGGIYAVVRCEDDAHALVAYLRNERTTL